MKILCISMYMIIGGLTFSACSSLSFNYKWRILNYEASVIQGTTPDDDQPLEICKKDASGYKCVVIMMDEFFRLKGDKEKCDADLDTLQRTCNQ